MALQLTLFPGLGKERALNADPFAISPVVLQRGKHFIGRAHPDLPGVTDNRVSRQQLEIVVGEENVFVVRNGRNPSTICLPGSNSELTLKIGEPTPLPDGATLFLLPETYPLIAHISLASDDVESPTKEVDPTANPNTSAKESNPVVAPAPPAAEKPALAADMVMADKKEEAAKSKEEKANETPAATAAPAKAQQSPDLPSDAVPAKNKQPAHEVAAPSKKRKDDESELLISDEEPRAVGKKSRSVTESKKHNNEDAAEVVAPAAAKKKKAEGDEASHQHSEQAQKKHSGKAEKKDSWFREISGDLFSSSASLVHCVSADLAMSKGIAKVICEQFFDQKKLADLERQGASVGEVAIARIGDRRYVFNLITKNRFFDKPTYKTMEASLQALRDRCKALGIDQLAMPQLGCGMDKLEWPKVKELLSEVFSDGKITITVYNISASQATTSSGPASPKKPTAAPAAAGGNSFPPAHQLTSSGSAGSSAAIMKKPKMTWKEEGTLLIYDSPSLPNTATLVAAFDLDGTLVQPKSGNKFPKGRDDWVWMYPNVVKSLTFLAQSGARVMIISNQKGITGANGKTRKEEITGKLTDICAQLPFPVQCYVATSGDHWRKPNADIWDLIVSRSATPPDPKVSFYVGDAAGRKGDHSDSDRGFAVNAGIGFQTPEEFFLKQAAQPFAWRGFDPHAALSKPTVASISIPGRQELVLCVGPPAVGKSTYVLRNFVPKKYERVNQDTLGTKEKCLAEAEKHLSAGKAVVIDNTNPAKATRALYLSLAKKYHVPARCLVFSTDLKLAKHLNHVRERLQGTSLIPDIAYRMFTAKFEEPSVNEGFEQVIAVPFVPEFSTDKHKRIYLQRTSPA